MIKYFLILILMMFPVLLPAQVFGSGETLRKGKSSVGFNVFAPQVNENQKAYLFIHMDHGIAESCDIDVKVGFTGDETYLGGDVEWQLSQKIVFVSFTAGMHKFDNFGLDAILTLMLPMGGISGVYMGSDLDIEFVDKERITPSWIFIGMKVGLGRKTYLLGTLEGAMNRDAVNIVSGGVKFDI